jgi:hypothetical protein
VENRKGEREGDELKEEGLGRRKGRKLKRGFILLALPDCV